MFMNYGASNRFDENNATEAAFLQAKIAELALFVPVQGEKD